MDSLTPNNNNNNPTKLLQKHRTEKSNSSAGEEIKRESEEIKELKNRQMQIQQQIDQMQSECLNKLEVIRKKNKLLKQTESLSPKPNKRESNGGDEDEIRIKKAATQSKGHNKTKSMKVLS
jgi:hypothetical protein